MSTAPITASITAGEAAPLPLPQPAESIAAPAADAPAAHAPAAQVCADCAALLAADQRYCLECGARRADARSEFLDALHPRARAGSAPGTETGAGAGALGSSAVGIGSGGSTAHSPSGAVALVAGVGVLLLAMGVGVLIGRSGAGHSPVTVPAAQVISVAGAGTASNTPVAATFTADWPAARNGWTVQLQTLPSASTQPDAVAAAKVAASGRGATDVGALKSDDYPSLTPGSYVVYSGVYTSKQQAQKQLAGLKHSFPSATVVKVSSGSGAAGAGDAGGTTGGSSHPPPSSEAHPAPPSVLNNLRSKSSGQSFEQKSKNLPNVVSTG